MSWQVLLLSCAVGHAPPATWPFRACACAQLNRVFACFRRLVHTSTASVQAQSTTKLRLTNISAPAVAVEVWTPATSKTGAVPIGASSGEKGSGGGGGDGLGDKGDGGGGGEGSGERGKEGGSASGADMANLPQLLELDRPQFDPR